MFLLFLIPPVYSYVINADMGPRLDGFGAISGGGATSRLLFQYSAPVVKEILDLLFLPSYGASLHHLKVEIGGDGQSSEGVEPSHMHSNTSSPNFSRGYEWRLMKEARARNPEILLSALAWTWPGWVGAGTKSPWTDPDIAVDYIISWLEGARDTHNITLNFINADWNERGFSPSFVLALRKALDARAFSYLGIVCGDDAHLFSCAEEAERDSVFRSSIVALGSHGPSLPSPIVPSVPLWNTEVHVTDSGGTDLSTIFARYYTEQNITSGTLWNVLSAYNPGLFSPDWGIFRAWWPWCDYYEPIGKLWVFAHWTQGTRPGMHWLKVGSGTGNLSGGGVYVSFFDAVTHDFTLIVYKPSDGVPENATFTLNSTLLFSIASLFAAKSSVVSGLTSTTPPDLDSYFVVQPNGVIVDPSTHSAQFFIRPGDLWTLTTIGNLTKGDPLRSVTTPTPFPSSFHDTFEDCVPYSEAPYWTDMTGAWECVADERGIVMQQVVPAHPLAWRPEEQRPFSLFAANISLKNVNVSVGISLNSRNDSALLGVRANPNCCGRVITGEDLMPGAWLLVSGGFWAVFNAIANVSTVLPSEGLIAHGMLEREVIPGEWYRVGLTVQNDFLSGWIDGTNLFSAVSVAGQGVPDNGFVGIGTGTWGQYVSFDDFAYLSLDD